MRVIKTATAIWICLSTILLSQERQENAALDNLLKDPALWQIPRTQFIEQYRDLGFAWNSSAQDVAETRREGITLFGLPVYQALARFSSDKLSNVTVSFYNRGDAGEMRREQFEELVRKSADALSAFTGQKYVERGKDASSAVKALGLIWDTDKSRFVLEYSFTREVKSRNIPYRAEFVRLDVTAPQQKQTLLSGVTSAGTPQPRNRGNIKREPDGDVIVDAIPMVDQGEKGYCVVASVERVMRYYGNDVDEHELAQIANSSASEGTSMDAMIGSLKKLTARLRIKTRVIEEMNVRSLLDMIADYNRHARRGKRAPEIDTSGAILDVGQIYGRMNVDVLREVRTKNKSAMNRFQRTVEAHIQEGVPLLWCVMLGLVPEANIPQGAGGHMRLIIGYNTKAAEVIYSDSWGPGHEVKRMPLADAWTITTGLHSIEPI
jgi:Peptidase_C39 like family